MSVLRTPPIDMLWLERLGQPGGAFSAAAVVPPSVLETTAPDRLTETELSGFPVSTAADFPLTEALVWQPRPVEPKPLVPQALVPQPLVAAASLGITAFAFAPVVAPPTGAVQAATDDPILAREYTCADVEIEQLSPAIPRADETIGAGTISMPDMPPPALDATTTWQAQVEGRLAQVADIADLPSAAAIADSQPWPRVLSSQDFAIPHRGTQERDEQAGVVQQAEVHAARRLFDEAPMELPDPVDMVAAPAAGQGTAAATHGYGGYAADHRAAEWPAMPRAPRDAPHRPEAFQSQVGATGVTMGWSQAASRQGNAGQGTGAATMVAAVSVARPRQLQSRRSVAVLAGVVTLGLTVASIAGVSDVFSVSGVTTASAERLIGEPDNAAPATPTATTPTATTATATAAAAPHAPAGRTGWQQVGLSTTPDDERAAPAFAMPPRSGRAVVGAFVGSAVQPSPDEGSTVGEAPVMQPARAVRVAALDPQMMTQPMRSVRVASTAAAPATGEGAGERGGPAARPKLVLDMTVPSLEAARVPFPLRIEGQDAATAGGRLVIRGLPEHATMSRGRLAGAGTWQVPLNNLQELALSIPPMTPGEFELLIELRSGTGELISSGLSVVHVVPRPRSVASAPVARRTALDPSQHRQAAAGAIPPATHELPLAAASTGSLRSDAEPNGTAVAPAAGQGETTAPAAIPAARRRPVVARRLAAGDPYRSGLGASALSLPWQRGGGGSPRYGGQYNAAPAAAVFDQRKGI